MQPDAGGVELVPYTGADRDALTVEGELNKLAANVGIARNFAGVHWRSDYSASVKLGEQIAYYFLQDTAQTYNEDIAFSWREMDGTARQVAKVSLPPPFLGAALAASDAR